MILVTPRCPECGKEAEGSVDSIPAIALFSEIGEDGHVEYNGTTRVCWNGQMPDRTDEGTLVQCHDAHEWRTRIVETSYDGYKLGTWSVLLDLGLVSRHGGEKEAETSALELVTRLRA